jgi:hypothetical protein
MNSILQWIYVKQFKHSPRDILVSSEEKYDFSQSETLFFRTLKDFLSYYEEMDLIGRHIQVQSFLTNSNHPKPFVIIFTGVYRRLYV